MVAGCPKCSARYRVDPERIGPEGAKLRCTKCSAVFLVRAPQAAAPAPVQAPVPVQTRVAAAPVAVAPPSEDDSSVSPPEPTPEYDSAKLVIIADPDEERGKASAEAVVSWGLQAHLVQDGVEAMLAIQRMLPSAVVLDAALPKMFGFQVCEVIKRNESLQKTTTVLVGAIHHQDRYRRDPSELYGADVYIEQPDLPEALKSVLREGGLPVDSDGPSPFAPPAERTPDEPVATPAAAMPASSPEPEFSFKDPTAAPAGTEQPQGAAASIEVAEDPEKTEERERAERLARIAVSEMLLYQPEKFEKAVRAGNLEQVLDLEIKEARALLRQRIGEEVRAETDFVMDELNRVAAERGAEG
jgi:predicted Zn finger-like uncharacterized protein